MAMTNDELNGLSATEREFAELMEDDEEMAAAMGRDLPDEDDDDPDGGNESAGKVEGDKADGNQDDDLGDDDESDPDKKQGDQPEGGEKKPEDVAAETVPDKAGEEDKPEAVEAFAPERHTPSDAGAQRQTLLAERTAALSKLIDGEMEAEEYAKIDAKVQDKLDALTRAESIDQARDQINRDTMMNEYGRELGAVLKQGKEAGIEGLDDPDSEAAKTFDRAVRMYGQDAAARGLSDSPGNLAASKDALNEALAHVIRRHGKPQAQKTAEEPPAAGKPAAKPRSPVDRSKLPPTLAAIPVAADAAVGGGEFSHLGGLEGPALERALAKLSDEQMERYLD